MILIFLTLINLDILTWVLNLKELVVDIGIRIACMEPNTHLIGFIGRSQNAYVNRGAYSRGGEQSGLELVTVKKQLRMGSRVHCCPSWREVGAGRSLLQTRKQVLRCSFSAAPSLVCFTISILLVGSHSKEAEGNEETKAAAAAINLNLVLRLCPLSLSVFYLVCLYTALKQSWVGEWMGEENKQYLLNLDLIE